MQLLFFSVSKLFSIRIIFGTSKVCIPKVCIPTKPTNFFDEFFQRRISYLLTIASFRIRVPSILFFGEFQDTKKSFRNYLTFKKEQACRRLHIEGELSLKSRVQYCIVADIPRNYISKNHLACIPRICTKIQVIPYRIYRHQFLYNFKSRLHLFQG